MKYFLGLMIFLYVFLIGCSINNKMRYKETIATICNYERYDRTNPFIDGLISGSMLNTNDLKWSNYSFTIKKELNEYYNDEGAKSIPYEIELWGEDYGGFEIGEKFIVKYDAKKLDNDHSHLIYYRPVFLDNEKTKTTKGRIKTIHGKDKQNEGAVGITFEYCYIIQKGEIKAVNKQDTLLNHNYIISSDSIKLCYSRYQYLSPNTNIDSLKSNLTKEYKVIYSIDNPKRAILYLNN